MRHYILLVVALCALLLTTSCKRDKRYADYVIEENEKIDKYIKNKGIKVVDMKPEQTEGEWLDENGAPIYYKTPSGLYYHQISLGDTTATKPKVSSRVYVRYDGYNLWDELIYSTNEKYAASPQSFIIQNSTSSSTFGVGFQEAVSYLNKGGRCSAIISFKIGNGDNTTIDNKLLSDEALYTPMFYDIRLINVN